MVTGIIHISLCSHCYNLLLINNAQHRRLVVQVTNITLGIHIPFSYSTIPILYLYEIEFIST